MKNNKKRNIILITLGIIIIFGIGLLICSLVNNKKLVEYHVINGVVTSFKDNVLLVKDSKSGAFYSVTVKENNFSLGDTIAVYSKDPILETYPAQVKASKIDLLEKANNNEDIIMIEVPVAKRNLSETEQIKESDIEYKSVPKNSIQNDSNIITNKEDIVGKYVYQGKTIHKDYFFYLDDITNTKTIKETNNNNNIETIPQTKTEADVVNYFTTLNNDLDKQDNSQTFTRELKNGFVTVIDFLFYNGEIYGYTFNQLTNSAKQQILKLALWIDSKIEIVFPGYKDTLGQTYKNIKDKIISTYLDLTTKICNNDPNLCEQAKEDFTQMKKSFSLTWEFLKDLLGSGINKLNDWYLIWKET